MSLKNINFQRHIWVKKYKFLNAYIKMEKVIRFGDNSLTNISSTQRTQFNKKCRFDKVLVSNKVSFGKKGFKYFIGYKDL